MDGRDYNGRVVSAFGCFCGATSFHPEARWGRLHAQSENSASEGKYQEAAAAETKALELAQEKFDAHDARLLTSLKHLARLEAKLGDSTQAQALAQRALDEMDAQLLKLWGKREFEESMALAEEYVDLSQTVLGPESGRLATGLEDEAEINSKLGKPTEALEAAKQALDIAAPLQEPTI